MNARTKDFTWAAVMIALMILAARTIIRHI